MREETSQPVESHEFPWYAVQVKPRAEKAVSAALRLKGYAEFLPL